MINMSTSLNDYERKMKSIESMHTFEPNRKIDIDIVRFLGILLVLIGHVDICPQVSHGIEWFIALFHVAVFYIAAGYVYKEVNQDNIKSVLVYILQRIRGLWIPFIFINFLMEFVFWIRSGLKSFDFQHLVKILFMLDTSGYVQASWFVIAIFYISITNATVAYALKILIKNSKMREAVHFIIAFSMLMLGFTFQQYLNKQLVWVLIGYIMFYFGRIIRRVIDSYKVDYHPGG